jgi:peptidoglycan LD-endopeptidase LytH
MNLQDLLRSADMYPLMGEELSPENTQVLNLTATNMGLEALDVLDTDAFCRFVDEQLGGKKYGIGGYMERRELYRRSNVFANNEAFRNIHLGTDIWTGAGAPVYAPLSGKIHSFQDNAGFGNYGPTIILEHKIKDLIFYTLYGHLMRKDLEGLKEGQHVEKGEVICHLGHAEENGNWPPHLHFQIMTDLLGNHGDFPGVSAFEEMNYYRNICLDPDLLIRFSGLQTSFAKQNRQNDS